MEVKVSVRKIRVEVASPREIKVTVGGGSRCVVDNDVTELSPNPVKSSGIWAFVTGLINNLTSWISSTFSTKDELPHFSDTFTGDGSEEAPYDVELPDAIIPDFNPYYFKGSGTALDPIDLKVENLPSGGGGKRVKFIAEQNTSSILFTKWDDGSDFKLENGYTYIINALIFSGHYTTLQMSGMNFFWKSGIVTGVGQIRFTGSLVGVDQTLYAQMKFTISNNFIQGVGEEQIYSPPTGDPLVYTAPTSNTNRFYSITDLSDLLPKVGLEIKQIGGNPMLAGTIIIIRRI